MPLYQVILILITGLTTSITLAYTPKEGNVSAVLGLTAYKTNFSGSPTGATAPYLGGAGVMALGDLNDKGSLEVGMFYMNKLYFRDENEKYIGEQTQLMHISMGYRYWFHSSFSTSLSLFSAYSMGQPQIVHSDFSQGSEATTSARDKTEYGFDLALQGDLFNIKKMTLVWDARYSRSVTAKTGERADHYGLLLGVRYFIQGKQRQ